MRSTNTGLRFWTVVSYLLFYIHFIMSVMSCNDHEVPELIEFARRKQVDISFIEEMPLGIVSGHNRKESFCSSDEVHDIITRHHKLVPATADSGGPAR